MLDAAFTDTPLPNSSVSIKSTESPYILHRLCNLALFIFCSFPIPHWFLFCLSTSPRNIVINFYKKASIFTFLLNLLHLSYIAYKKQCHCSRTGMRPDYCSDIINQFCCDLIFLFDFTGKKFCFFTAVPMTDKNHIT